MSPAAAASVTVKRHDSAGLALDETNRRSDVPTSFASGRRRLVQLAYRFCWNHTDAEDAVQDAMAIAHQRREKLHDESKWWSWVCRIVVRRCLSLRRSEGRHAQRIKALAEQSGPAMERPSRRLETSERAEAVRWAVEQLPPQQRTAVTLRHLQEMSYERIAEIMEISPSTARVHVHAGQESMRKAILRRDPDFGIAATRRKRKDR